MGAGNGPHVCLMDFSLTPEQELIRATAREFCARELVPNARAWDEAEELPRSLVARLADAGFLAASLPEELSGGGLDSISYCLLCEELGRADSSVRGIVSVSNGLFGKTVAKWGSDEQRAAWLPRLGAGEALGWSSRAQNSRAVARISSCSGVRVKSMRQTWGPSPAPTILSRDDAR